MTENFDNFDLSDTEEKPKKTAHPILENKANIERLTLQKRESITENSSTHKTQGHEILKKLKQKVTSEKSREREPSQLALKQIGLGEEIYKLSDLYLPLSSKTKAAQLSLVDTYSGLKEIKEFERKCMLPPFDLNEAFASFEKNLLSLSPQRQAELPKGAPEGQTQIRPALHSQAKKEAAGAFGTEGEFETSYRYPADRPVNYASYFDYFDELARELQADINHQRFVQSQEAENYRELLKSVSQIRKERIEEEQQRRFIRESSKKKAVLGEGEWNLEAMIRSNNINQMLATPTLGANKEERDWGGEPEEHFGLDFAEHPSPFFAPGQGHTPAPNPNASGPFGSLQQPPGALFAKELDQTPFFANPMLHSGAHSFSNFNPPRLETSFRGGANAKSVVAKFEQYFALRARGGKEAGASAEDEEEHLIAFKRLLARRRAASNICLKRITEFSADLKLGNLFNYLATEIEQPANKKSPESAQLIRLDLYHVRRRSAFEQGGGFQYKNPLVGADMFEGPQASFLAHWGRQLPYLDKNDQYVRAVIENYNEENLLRDKPEYTIVIDQVKRDKDHLMEQKSMQIKKIMRIDLARGNRMGDISEDVRLEILRNKDSEIGRLIGMNAVEDLNENEELVKNKKRKLKPIVHTKVATDFELHDFVVVPEKIVGLYRNDINTKVIFQLLFEKNVKWRFKVVNRRQEETLKTRLKLSGRGASKVIQSHDIFGSLKRLSLRSDDFVLVEYVEREPLILGDFGMASRLERWIYPTRLANFILENKLGYDPKQKDKDKMLSDSRTMARLFNETVTEVFGSKGEEIFLIEKDKLPTVGQLTSKNYCGLSLLDNNLARTPVFVQAPRRTDFLLVCSVIDGERRYFLRKIRHVYVAGQIQPKQEVFSPYSRQYNNFLRKFLKFYIKSNFERNNQLNIDEVKSVFPTINDHNLRKQIKLMGGDEDPSDKKLFYQTRESTFEQEEIAGDGNLSVSPEDVCLYYRMHQSMFKLLFMGVEELKSTDKLSVLRTKFYRKNLADTEKTLIAKRILEEIQLSAWNVSQSFLVCLLNQGRMFLQGFGDPTNGHGGVNFIKVPLKISRYESMLLKLSQRNKPSQIVTGTGSDLRCLPMKFVHKKLKQHGYNEEVLVNLERWDKILLLRDVANKMLEDKNAPQDEELIKFSRNMRMTTEKQTEKYQMDINKLFMKMIDTLSNKDPGKIADSGEVAVEEDWGQLLAEQVEELERYKALDNSDEEELAKIKPREIKKKTIVLKPLIKRNK